MGLGTPALSTNQKRDGAGAGGSHTALSVTGDGSVGTPIELVNDAAAPGADRYYSTSYAGVKGYQQPDVPWFNMVKGGADNTGVVDCGPIVASAIAAGFTVIYFPAGLYLQNTTVALPDGTTIRGAGPGQAVIKTTANASMYTCGFRCSFYELGFRGDNPSGKANQQAIKIDTVNGVSISNCWFDFFAGTAVYAIGTNNLPGTQGYWSNFIIGNRFTTNINHIWLDVRAEYFVVEGNSINDSGVGITIAGGNNLIVGNNLTSTGLLCTGGANNGHGIIANNTINHAGAFAVVLTGVTLGMTFSNNMVYYGGITITNSPGIQWWGGDIDGLGALPITVTNSANVFFTGVRFITPPVWVITGVPPTVVSYDTVAQSWSLIDPVNAKQLDIAQVNGVTSFAGTGNTKFLMGSTVDNGTGKALQVAGGISTADPVLLRGTVAFTDGAAAQAGTLLNAPIAGNPTKWIPVNDNGTTRYIPAW